MGTMSCFLIPTSPFVKLAFLPRLVIGYPSYPTATPTVPQTQAAIATATAASFPRQPLAVTQGSVTVNGSIQGTAASIQLLRTALPNPHSPQSAYHGNLTTGLNGSYHKSFRSGYHKGIKRKADELDSADSTGDGDANPKPLYCKICRVTLNAPAQAKQHYEGKNHTRKIKVMTDGKSAENGTESSDQVSTTTTTNGTISPSKTTAEVTPEVYCKICGVSFNSGKQAHQHYQGKNHGKRARAANSHSPDGTPVKCCDEDGLRRRTRSPTKPGRDRLRRR